MITWIMNKVSDFVSGSRLKYALDVIDEPTPEHIALRLHTHRIGGRKRAALNCPLANYLRNITGASNVVVGTGYAYAVIEGRHQQAALSDSQQEFIKRFDAGFYRYLQTKDEK